MSGHGIGGVCDFCFRSCYSAREQCRFCSLRVVWMEEGQLTAQVLPAACLVQPVSQRPLALALAACRSACAAMTGATWTVLRERGEGVADRREIPIVHISMKACYMLLDVAGLVCNVVWQSFQHSSLSIELELCQTHTECRALG